ncbi:solute carrier family 23 protein [Bengtsoniella intestinalis]|uniref:uracil-xanthine permease family protein n=1 Tax=Bengtsoniella intestinalis TaxID=3073143 RepID=UPI00391F8788
MKEQPTGQSTLFTLTGRPPFGAALSMALQHLMAMIVGCVTPAIIIANAAGLSVDDQVRLIQASLLVSALATLCQIFMLGKWFGSGLPVMLGISFAYVPTMQAIVGAGGGIGAIVGATMVGGVVAMVVGFFSQRIRKHFPPVITGTVVFTIGLSLYPTAINYMAGGTSNSYALVVETEGLTSALVYGSWQNWLVAVLTLVFVMVLSNKGTGVWKLASILLGMAGGYMVALCFGMVDFSGIASATWISVPQPLYFGVSFELAPVITMSLLFAINSIQAIGDFTATTVGGLGREPSDRELQGGIVTYGFTNILGALFCGLPTATYSQNVGIVSTNKVVNRCVFLLAGLFLLLAGISPKFSAVLTTIPQCVLGGGTITVFATIAMTGMKLIASQGLSPRNTTIVGLSAALGVGISQSADALSQFPDTITMIFGNSPVVLATILAIALNLILPKEDA